MHHILVCDRCCFSPSQFAYTSLCLGVGVCECVCCSPFPAAALMLGPPPGSHYWCVCVYVCVWVVWACLTPFNGFILVCPGSAWGQAIVRWVGKCGGCEVGWQQF